MTTTDEASQRAYYQATAASYHDRHMGRRGRPKMTWHWVLLLMLGRNEVLISDNNNIGKASPQARRLKKLMKKLGLWAAFVWLQTKGKMRTFAHVPMMHTKGSGEANLLGSATHVAIVARRHTA